MSGITNIWRNASLPKKAGVIILSAGVGAFAIYKLKSQQKNVPSAKSRPGTTPISAPKPTPASTKDTKVEKQQQETEHSEQTVPAAEREKITVKQSEGLKVSVDQDPKTEPQDVSPVPESFEQITMSQVMEKSTDGSESLQPDSFTSLSLSEYKDSDKSNEKDTEIKDLEIKDTSEVKDTPKVEVTPEIKVTDYVESTDKTPEVEVKTDTKTPQIESTEGPSSSKADESLSLKTDIPPPQGEEDTSLEASLVRSPPPSSFEVISPFTEASATPTKPKEQQQKTQEPLPEPPKQAEEPVKEEDVKEDVSSAVKSEALQAAAVSKERESTDTNAQSKQTKPETDEIENAQNESNDNSKIENEKLGEETYDDDFEEESDNEESENIDKGSKKSRESGDETDDESEESDESEEEDEVETDIEYEDDMDEDDSAKADQAIFPAQTQGHLSAPQNRYPEPPTPTEPGPAGLNFNLLQSRPSTQSSQPGGVQGRNDNAAKSLRDVDLGREGVDFKGDDSDGADESDIEQIEEPEDQAETSQTPKGIVPDNQGVASPAVSTEPQKAPQQQEEQATKVSSEPEVTIKAPEVTPQPEATPETQGASSAEPEVKEDTKEVAPPNSAENLQEKDENDIVVISQSKTNKQQES